MELRWHHKRYTVWWKAIWEHLKWNYSKVELHVTSDKTKGNGKLMNEEAYTWDKMKSGIKVHCSINLNQI